MNMAGRGPQPKAVEKRARTNKDPIPMRILPRITAEQPNLPEFKITKWEPDENGEGVHPVLVDYVWATRTREWWQMWRDAALSIDFTSTDWSELLDTALIHSEFWSGAIKLAGELRLRTAKFGATPEDRARLRIQFAAADEAEGIKRVPRSARDRFGSVSSDMPALEA